MFSLSIRIHFKLTSCVAVEKFRVIIFYRSRKTRTAHFGSELWKKEFLKFLQRKVQAVILDWICSLEKLLLTINQTISMQKRSGIFSEQAIMNFGLLR